MEEEEDRGWWRTENGGLEIEDIKWRRRTESGGGLGIEDIKWRRRTENGGEGLRVEEDWE